MADTITVTVHLEGFAIEHLAPHEVRQILRDSGLDPTKPMKCTRDDQGYVYEGGRLAKTDGASE